MVKDGAKKKWRAGKVERSRFKKTVASYPKKYVFLRVRFKNSLNYKCLNVIAVGSDRNDITHNQKIMTYEMPMFENPCGEPMGSFGS